MSAGAYGFGDAALAAADTVVGEPFVPVVGTAVPSDAAVAETQRLQRRRQQPQRKTSCWRA